MRKILAFAAIFAFVSPSSSPVFAQATVAIDTSPAGKQQVIDGFGTLSSGPVPSWYNDLYLNDMYCSMVRVYLTPSFVSPYSDHLYNSPWYGNYPALPGPDNNNVRTYTGASASSAQPYTRTWTFNDPYNPNNTQPIMQAAKIAVMGPDIDANGKLLVINPGPAEAATLAQLGQGSKLQQLGDFKLFGSFWSPQPWVKLTSGGVYPPNSGTPFPTAGTPFPFIWNGNFAGGILDVTGTTLPEFNDGTQNTSALTQFARMVSAQLRKIQNAYSVKFYAISIQNEPNFEEFYDSCQYPSAAGYATAVQAVRTELNRYPDLAAIKIEGPEDVLGDDAYSMWQYGSGNTATDKNLKFLASTQNTAASALDFFSIHGYDNNGVSSTGAASPTGWNYWTKGWTTSPAPGLPNNVQGINSYQRKSWMTETSGESAGWLDSSTSGGFPDSGAFSIALKIHQALTAGQESAWVYYQFNDGTTPTDASSLTDGNSLANGPKYVAAKHFFRYIRPNSYRVNTTVGGSSTVLASSYVNDANQSLTTVLINSSSTATTATVAVPSYPSNISSFQTFTSSNGSYWQPSTTAVQAGQAVVSLPGYSVATLTATSPLQLLSAVSRRQQGSTAYDIPLALTGKPAVECRGTPSLNSYSIVLNFSQAVTGGSAMLALQAGQNPNLHLAGSASSPTTNGSTMTINLTGVGDEQRLVLHVTGVQPGNLSYDIPMNILWADVDGNGAVNSQDLIQVRNAIGTTAGQTGFNARADIDENGAVNSQDLIQVRNDIATTLP